LPGELAGRGLKAPDIQSLITEIGIGRVGCIILGTVSDSHESDSERIARLRRTKPCDLFIIEGPPLVFNNSLK
jgi:hypothetical protein